MISAPLPSNESARLAYLRSVDLLDTPPEQDFDDVVLLASQICQTPISLVSLVDAERQWFKAKFGVESSFCGSSRETAFCAHAILRPDLMVVEDALLDERFRDNPLVINPPHVRFYAGMPLITPQGLGIGTLCVVDTVPRKLTDGQATALRTLARQLMCHIQLRHFARHDPLTGLSNRIHFIELLQRRIEKARREPGKLFAAVSVALDRLSPSNEGPGNPVGDQFLTHIADRLNGCLRTSDVIVCPDSRQPAEIARLGGEEFTILLDRVRKPVDAARVASRILKALAKPMVVWGHELVCRPSIGVVVSGGVRNYQTAEELLRDVDLAMNRAKAQGHNQYVLFNTPMHKAAVARLELESDLHLALERGEFLLHYQPILCLATGRVHAMEALLRWKRDGKMVGPADFLPAAEDMGLTLAIGRWVLAKSVRHLALWRSENPQLPRFKLALNLTSKQLGDPQLLTLLESSTAEAGVDISDIELEVTEGSVMESSLSARRTSNSLRASGVRMSLDDFGAGPAPITCLHQFPVHIMKIDKSFLEALPSRLDKSAVVSAVTALAHSLKLSVVAEGIETQEQAQHMQSLHCDFGQGFFFSRPLTPEGVQRYLSETRTSVAA